MTKAIFLLEQKSWNSSVAILASFLKENILAALALSLAREFVEKNNCFQIGGERTVIFDTHKYLRERF